ncbi:hypothetical protein Rsub_12478 [Raphidocelis subcapitata]|uniref:CREG-like beta-barrel domain-containing protein n=1 Tax=Raphidocelis subcapitata TaxID=307507 RepID=A0A2V0PJD6_9CHLO|nr:hypothetical protein Rsub_12478 [Raphidocelis subcapitata]|eukprot:GBF99659.1 hypothetical protein Rsub_12478 [Raphidocelis subcapitata]
MQQTSLRGGLRVGNGAAAAAAAPRRPAAPRARPPAPRAARGAGDSNGSGPADHLPSPLGSGDFNDPFFASVSDFDYASLSSLDLPYESQQQQRVKRQGSSGLARTTGTTGVETATEHYELPSPAVAVRNLVEQAQYAHLCTTMSGMHHRRSHYPFGTLVDFATDGAGMPIFCLSPLAIHARNLAEDPRCSLVVQMPGWTGLANARVTIFGDVYKLPQDMQAGARDVFLAKQAQREKWVMGNWDFFRMHRITDIYFVGGFGTVAWMDVADYLRATPDAIATNTPQRTLAELNAEFSRELRAYVGGDEALFISIDALGVDLRVRCGAEFSVQRIGFHRRVADCAGACAAVAATLRGGAAEGGGAGAGPGAAGAPAGGAAPAAGAGAAT